MESASRSCNGPRHGRFQESRARSRPGHGRARRSRRGRGGRCRTGGRAWTGRGRHLAAPPGCGGLSRRRAELVCGHAGRIPVGSGRRRAGSVHAGQADPADRGDLPVLRGGALAAHPSSGGPVLRGSGQAGSVDAAARPTASTATSRSSSSATPARSPAGSGSRWPRRSTRSIGPGTAASSACGCRPLSRHCGSFFGSSPVSVGLKVPSIPVFPA